MPTDAPQDRTADELRAVRERNDRATTRALLIAVLAGVLVDVGVIVLSFALADASAQRGALIGAALALVVTLPTLLSSRLSRGLAPLGEAMLFAGSWLTKMFVLVIVLLLIRDVAGFSRPWLGIALLLGALAAAVTEAVILLRNRSRLEVPGASEGPQDPVN